MSQRISNKTVKSTQKIIHTYKRDEPGYNKYEEKASYYNSVMEFKKEKYKLAEDNLKESITRIEKQPFKAKSDSMKFKILLLYSIIKYYEKSYLEAEKFLLSSLAMAKDLKNKRFEGTVIYHLAVIHMEQDFLGIASNYSSSARKIFSELRYYYGVAHIAYLQGMIGKKRGNYDVAIEKFKTSLNLFSELQDNTGKAFSRYNIGLILLIKGDPVNADLQMDQALKIFTEAFGERKYETILIDLIEYPLDQIRENCELIYFKPSANELITQNNFIKKIPNFMSALPLSEK